MSFIFRESANAKNHGATEHAGDEMLFTHSELPLPLSLKYKVARKACDMGDKKNHLNKQMDISDY